MNSPTHPVETRTVTPALRHAPRRIRPPFDVGNDAPADDQRPGETADQWSNRRHADRVAALLEALDGVELGDYDHRIIAWLAGWEPTIVGTVASLLYRTHEAGGCR